MVGPDGVIRHKFIGPLTADQVDSVLKPLIQEALKPS